jgi:mRNA interferase MazF
MTGFEFGDVVLVRFPFSDHSTVKQRPAAVISSAAYHQARPDLLIMAISSQIRSWTAFAEPEIRHWKAAGLLKPSVIKELSQQLGSLFYAELCGRIQIGASATKLHRRRPKRTQIGTEGSSA